AAPDSKSWLPSTATTWVGLAVRRSRASVCASSGRPRSVRSPASTITSPARLIAANRGSKAPCALATQWRSPTAAMRIAGLLVPADRRRPAGDVLLRHAPVRRQPGIGVAPDGDVGQVLGA